jgi:hypothetical protein
MCTFTGGKTGAVMCGFQSAAWDSAANRTTISVGTPTGATPSVLATYIIASKPMAVSYSGGMADTTCTLTINDGSRSWTADTGMSLGACALMLRSVLTSDAGNDMFTLHGALSASLQPDDGMGSAVTMQSSF